MTNPKLTDEEGRIAALERYAVLDTPREEAFDKITRLVQTVMGVPICAVSLVDRDRQWFKSVQGLGVSETPRSVAFCSHTIKIRRPLIIPDARADARFSDNSLVIGPPYIVSYAGVPLLTPDGYNVGALCAIDRVPREFSEPQIEILKSFASLVVDELELRRISEIDHLTGALSRRGFLTQVGKDIERYQRHQRDSVLVMLDVDHFKSVNDRFGHPAGDKVLQAISSICRQNLRLNDAFGRLGGEEFGILLSETSASQGFLAAEKVRRAINDLHIDVEGGLRVTASFGVSPLKTDIRLPDQWFSEADRALYAAKRLGRNRCVMEGDVLDAVAA